MVRIALAIAAGVVIGFWMDDPADRVETVTVTEEVAVPGPEVVRYEQAKLPDACLSYIERSLDQLDHVRNYTAAVADQGDNFNDALQALMLEDTTLINASITRQRDINSAGMDPLRQMIETEHDYKNLAEQCEAEMEDLQ